MSTKMLKKVVIAIALALAVTFSAAPWEKLTGLPITSSVQACGGPGMGSGGGGGC
jgi:hypothetical protein